MSPRFLAEDFLHVMTVANKASMFPNLDLKFSSAHDLTVPLASASTSNRGATPYTRSLSQKFVSDEGRIIAGYTFSNFEQKCRGDPPPTLPSIHLLI